MVLEEAANVFPALANTLARVAVPGARLLHDILDYGKIEHIAFARDAFSIENVELCFAERRGYFVLDYLDLGARADDYIAFFDCRDAANVDAHRGVELERTAAGRGFRVAEHDADLLADLVNENQRRARFRDCARPLAQ